MSSSLKYRTMNLRRGILYVSLVICHILICVGCDLIDDDDEQPLITKIAFSSTRDGNEEIYVMNSDGSDVVRLTNHLASDRFPSWSPDGEKIAFMSKRDNGAGSIYRSDIYVMNADGSDLMNLTPDDQVYAMYPCWSPDGTKIAFISEGEDSTLQIFVMNADGSNRTAITSGRHFHNAEPCWSPDGNKIAFASDRERGVNDIFMMNADGSNLVNLTKHPAVDESPCWSPDGDKIAFVSDRERSIDIHVMNADGTGIIRLTEPATGDGYAPAWSPWVRQ